MTTPTTTQLDYYELHQQTVRALVTVEGYLHQIAELPDVRLNEAPGKARSAIFKLQAAFSGIGQMQNIHYETDTKLTATQKMLQDVRGWLIYMRRYVIQHGILIGESVGWANLKRAFDVGRNSKEEDAWAREHGYLP